MTTKKDRRVALYVRLSVSQESSVSIERQKEAAQQYAEQRGWIVVGTFVDDGVSASKNRPEERRGWQQLMESTELWDAVIVWKLDRLVRRVVWFWDTYRWLDDHGKSVVSVMDNLDMTTPMGRIVAGIIAGFAEMEAEAISARVAGARQHLIRNGRIMGGKVPYGYRAVKNTDGEGWVLAQDPDTIPWVRGMVEKVRAGQSIYSVQLWLDESGVPTPTEKSTDWNYSTVERILRHPILAGQITFNPGNADKQRGGGILREGGLPVIYDELAIMTREQWLAMVAALDNRDSPQSKPVSEKASTSPLLSGFVFCGKLHKHEEPVRMHRATVQGRPGYSCPICHHAISNFQHVVVDEFLSTRGDMYRLSPVAEIREGGDVIRHEVALRLDELNVRLKQTSDADKIKEIFAEMMDLKEREAEAAHLPGTVIHEPTRGDRTFREDWDTAADDHERRAILGDAIARVVVKQATPGRRTDAMLRERLDIEWLAAGHIDPPTDEELASWS